MADSAGHYRQRPLELFGPFRPTLDNFLPGDNAALVRMLRELARHPSGWHYLIGAPGTGKTHLLWGMQQAALDSGQRALYVSLGAGAERQALLDNVEAGGMLLLDDAGHLRDSASWQRALFNSLQTAQQRQAAMLVAGREPVAAIPDVLPDLRSRLAAMRQWRVNPLPDADRPALIRHYLQRYQLALPADHLDYLLQRGPRRQERLIAVLERLADEWQHARQPVTKPMLRRILQTT